MRCLSEGNDEIICRHICRGDCCLCNLAYWHICCSKGSIILHNSEIGGIINEKQIRGAISYKPYFNNEL